MTNVRCIRQALNKTTVHARHDFVEGRCVWCGEIKADESELKCRLNRGYETVVESFPATITGLRSIGCPVEKEVARQV